MIRKSLRKRSCVFCREAHEPSCALKFLSCDWPFNDRILVEERLAFAIPGYGPQVLPYVLAVPKRHVTSISECESIERVELLKVVGYVATRIFDSEEVVVFEHGGCDPLTSCMDHAHLHVIPARFNLYPALAAFDSHIAHLTSDLIPGESGRTYLFLGNFSADSSKIVGRTAFTKQKKKQYFRRALALALGTEDYDWRLGMNEEFMVKTMRLAKTDNKASANFVP